jgi:hypothetical protein
VKRSVRESDSNEGRAAVCRPHATHREERDGHVVLALIPAEWLAEAATRPHSTRCPFRLDKQSCVILGAPRYNVDTVFRAPKC